MASIPSPARSHATKPAPEHLIHPEATSSAERNYKIIEKTKDFEKIQSTRPDFDHSNKPIPVTKHPSPTWQYGDGTPNFDPSKKHLEVDPHAPDRAMVHNYRLLISGIAPRPISFISTLSADGKTKNLAPMSYFQVIDHDPPMFVIGFSSRPGRVKDTYRNLKETGESVINTVSEDMIEAVNASSIDAPYGVSEWDVSGLHEAPSSTVQPSRVQESVFSVEAKVVEIKEFGDHQRDGMSVAGMVLVKATRFWVREDAAANEEVSHIDLDVLRPLAQLGGMSYGRIGSTFELPRKRWSDEVKGSELLSKLENGNSEV
ncbi:Nn.00g095860.m01.CDS01 [Neocucurbitaria sp. VM-36]